jgi:hypothetical protein
MPSETAEASAVLNGEIMGLFDQAVRAFGDSMKVAMKAHEDTVKLWGDACGKANTAQLMTSDWIPTAQKNAEEYLKLMETSYRRNADLMKKAMHSPNGSDGAGMEKRTREWLEASLEVARDNTQDLTNANLRVVQNWTDMFKKTTQQAAQQVSQHVSQQVAQQKAALGKQ